MNNLGGFSTIELVFIDEITNFTVSPLGATVSKNGTVPRVLPSIYEGSSLSDFSKYGASGTLYTHKAVLKLKNKMDAGLEAELRTVNARGCILIAADSNGNRKVYGSMDYPLLGTFDEEPGKNKSDLHHFRLTLQADTLHPAYLSI